MSQDPFIKRHIGTDERGVSEMLRTIGVRSTEELIEQVIPDDPTEKTAKPASARNERIPIRRPYPRDCRQK